jgi:hypothetical protein
MVVVNDNSKTQKKDYSKFLIEGKKIEDKFSGYFKNTKTASRYQDTKEHWDVKISANIDVKGIRKIDRYSEIDENFHWVEILNVNGYKGWAYSEFVDYFAFETFDYFIIVEKEKLQNFIKEKVKKEYVSSTRQALYKLYRRKDRKDLISLVKTIDLIYICDKIIKK